ncbi:DNA recombination protein RmuC [Candidatus Nomurabacteria bacterium CG_4_9_14_0_2_um_filter_32_10]|uniref:DNA recombination protein RmuC n=3 Tax=Candidatus Nomuraibacteriota TaxID=1752729 RepID=A0A2H0CHG1_9BACT|nr:MAG: DNA recombination protein RmuC [Candidatus Nomurabacteria bacterium CG22_combo_CG10-13_8_21_14_all_32_8]PIZ86367.1 MAG: DNA recombination protein RmuC [Candidatus Nomurabacteria bacterium CG_4_10_14_0_2_um_filter_33_9]PJC49647.1 MAG: DNA recombination protein RmuC [Candidatus Nomurabacteria bacterium CG_4_9_14_0_2_um_filter_32_10]
MENLTIIIIAFLIGGIIAYFLFGKRKEKDDTGIQLLTQVSELIKNVDNKLGESNKQVNESLRFHSSESNKIIRDVTEKLTKLDETNKQVISFADQLQSLENVLKNPKQRGILGEYYLETVLKNVLPPGSYQMQYPFPDGTIVDAVVFVKDKIIPIDSKFSLENYNKMAEETNDAEKKRLETVFVNDLKNRIVETAKYIQPSKNTTDFAFMFIPHEAIYYDLLTNKVGASEENENLIQRAAGKYKVIITSPTSFLAYLQTVLQGLKALKIEESAKEIIKKVEDLGKHLKSFDEYHDKLGNALGTVVNHYNASNKELKKIDKDVLRIAGTSPELSTLSIEKPRQNE